MKRYRVKVPAGVREGSRIRLAGKGEPGGGGGPAGDLYVVTHVAPSPVFKRKGDNLEVEVPDHDRRGGHGRHRRGADARRHEAIRIPAGTSDGSVQRLRGEGPRSSPGRGRGDIHYRFRIEIPKSLTSEQREAMSSSPR